MAERNRKKKKKEASIRARVSPETVDKLDLICELRSWSRSEAVRQGVLYLHDLVTSGPPQTEVDFQGDEETRAAKHLAIELARQRKGPAMVAREVGVTYREIKRWLEDDQLFAEFFEWARDETVEVVEHSMYLDATENDKLSAKFGFLNTHHSAWGLISRDYQERQFTKFLEKAVFPWLQQVLPRDKFLEFVAEARALPAKHLRQSPGRKPGGGRGK